MFHYVTLIWDPDNARACSSANRMASILLASSSLWTCTFSADGSKVFIAGASDSCRKSYLLAGGSGMIFGELFAVNRSVTSQAISPNLDANTTAEIVSSNGRHLLSAYWGGYIALVRSARRPNAFIIRDCSGKVPCYRTTFENVEIVFADINDIFPLRLPSFTVDVEYLAAFISWTQLQIRRTGLKEVTEVLAGECFEFQRENSRQFVLWDPREVYNKGTIEDHKDACSQLRETTQTCIDAWTSVFPKVLLGLSGGLDSAIVLGCLMRAPRLDSITCVNFYSPTSGDDERRFARAAAALHKVPLLEHLRTYDDNLFDEQLLSDPRSPKPTLALLFRKDEISVLEHLTKPIGAAAMWTGEGGDHLFLASQSPLGAIDYAFRHGVSFGLLSAFADAARLSGVPYTSILRSLRSARRGKGEFTLDNLFRVDTTFLSSGGLPKNPIEFLSNPWMSDRDDLPPGKREQIFSLADVLNRKRPVSGTESVSQHHPLLSQPLIELSLRVPTYVLCADGRQRGLARNAFSDLIPPEIANRFDKGETSSYLMDVIRGSTRFISALLSDGLLVQSGVLTPQTLAPYLKHQVMFRPQQITPFLACLAAEVWMRRWSSTAQQVAT